MKKIILGVISFCFLMPVAVNASCQDEALARIDDIHAQTQHLHCEIEQLRAQLNRLEHCKQPSYKFWPHNYLRDFQGPNTNCQDCDSVLDPTETGFADNTNYTNDFARMWGSPRNLLLLAALGSTVTTSPFLGLRSAFDASDLIVNLPTMNEDLRFLKEHVQIEKKLKCYGVQLPDRPIIELGGKIEGIMYVQDDYNLGPSTSDIDLGSARLDVLVEVSKGVHGFMAFNMDNSNFDLLNNSSLDIQLAGGGSRVFNSRVYVSRAFVTIGDLNCSPLYLTVGQMFVPFGRYASNMVTSTLTVEVGRINQRAILLGYYKDGLYASVYAFRGEANTGPSAVNAAGANLGYEKSWDNGSLNVGAGYVSNIADATGFQITGGALGFFGFGLNNSTELLVHAVSANDVHGEFSFGKFNLFAEYIWANQEFDYRNLSFDGHGAKPSASNVELAYNFKFVDKPASLAVGYGTTSQALALNVPKNSAIAAFNISIWKDTIQSLEFRHDNNYDISDFASGNAIVPVVAHSIGGSRNTYTLQMGVYF